MAKSVATPVRGVLLDALGTLVELQPPAPRLRKALRELAGVDVGEEAAAKGFAAEIAHYRANHLRGGDEAGLDALRDDCAAVLREALGEPRLDAATVRRAMLEALEFRAYPDAAPALRALSARGVRLVVASDWDCSLPYWLARTGLAELLDGAVSSAVVGEAKPSPAVFRAALEIAGVSPAQALHVGDSVNKDVAGARAAGLRAVLMARDGLASGGVEAIRSLEELTSLI
ncbi:MAG: HAD family hydrolase [Thermoleophilaceae bacterium]